MKIRMPCFFTSDFNGHSQHWWPDGDTNAVGNGIEELTLSLGLTQVIYEPTNFEPHKNPSCIHLIFTDQPNIIMESASLDALCHHQIIFCRANLNSQRPHPHPPPPPPPFPLLHMIVRYGTMIEQMLFP